MLSIRQAHAPWRKLIKRWLILLSLLAVALNACVPATQVGSTVENPLLLGNPSEHKPIRVAPGTTILVQGQYSGQQFGITSEMTRSMVNRQSLSSPIVGQVLRVRWEGFRGFAPILHTNPANNGGWDVQLVRADSFLSVEQIENRVALYRHGLELSFSIQVPANAVLGEHQISLLVNRENIFVRFPFTVNVVTP